MSKSPVKITRDLIFYNAEKLGKSWGGHTKTLRKK